MSNSSRGVIEFLRTDTPKHDLAITLRVLREFKEHESLEEWCDISFAAWAKLEQLEEFLDYLVNDAELRADTQQKLGGLSR